MSGSLPQLQTFQLPDVGGVVNALQGLELNRMRSQQLQGAEQERNALRQLMATPGFDPSSPDAARRLLEVAPTTGAATYQALMAGQREQRQAQTALNESLIKNIELGRELLAPIRDLPEVERPRAYSTWLAGMERRIPGFSNSVPREYSDAAYLTLMSKASEIVAGQRPRIMMGPFGPVEINQAGTGFRMIPETPDGVSGRGAPGAPTPRAEAPSLGEPGRDMAAAMLRRSEGFRAEPYMDVNALRAGYGSDTVTLADGRVVPVTQATRVTPEDAERDLARRIPEFERRAAAAVGEERFAALPPNVRAALISVAYNYGTLPGRIRNAVQSGDVNAIAAAVEGLAGDNQGINARRRGEEAAVIRGANAMVPGAAPVNAMLAPQDATAVTGMPQLPTFAPPRTLAEADYQKRMMDAVAELEKKRIEAERRRGEQPERVQEAGQTAEATARGQAVVRRAEQPARVEEAGQTVEAQERARIQTREAEAKRAEAEKLNTAISELERISRPGGLLERSTGSGIGRLVDIAGEFVGMSSRGAQAAAALAPIADVVLKMVPRFEGPQSDKDTAAYQAAAGRLADPTIPNETRLAAAREIVRLMRARRDQFSYTPGGATTPTAAPAAQTAPPVPAGVGMTQDNWSRLWGVMTPQERALWQN